MANRIKIMHIMLSLEVGGMENGLVNILTRSNDAVFDSHVCCLEKIGTLGERLSSSKTHIYNMEKKPGFSIGLILNLAKLLRKKKIDIIHTRCWATLLYGFFAGKLAHVPIHIHGEHGVFNLEYGRRVKLYKFFINHIDRILTVSESLKREIIAITGISPDAITPIINGVDTDKFFPRPRHALRYGLQLKDSDIVIGSVGRLENVKNYQAIIRCVSQFNHTSVKGILVGDGPQRAKLENYVAKLQLQDRFFFLGKRTDVEKLLPAFDIFVCSSLSEGLSNTILEAMACGLPVIATRVGGNPEIVSHGKTGYLVDVDSSDEMLTSCKHLVNNQDLACSLGKYGRDVVMKRYSLQKMVHEYENVYLSLSNRKGLK